MKAIDVVLEPACTSKATYGTEELARTVGRDAIRKRGVDLYVYKCPDCIGWHLTKREHLPIFHVAAPLTILDDFSGVGGEGTFWEKLGALEARDAVAELKRVRDRLRHLTTVASGLHQATLNRMLTSVNNELIIKGRVLDRDGWLKATANVLGDEALSQTKFAMARETAQTLIHTDCATAAAYDDEWGARQAGSRLYDADQSDRWVFPCAQCGKWHVTAKRRAKHWHVNARAIPGDDYTDLLSDRHFWRRLVDMHDVEAEQILRDKLQLIAEAMQDGFADNRMQVLHRRLKNEISLISERSGGFPITHALVSLFGDEAYELVKLEYLENLTLDSRPAPTLHLVS